MNCKFCNLPIDHTSKFCSHCGKKQRRSIIPLLISVIVITLISAGLFIYRTELFPETNVVTKIDQSNIVEMTIPKEKEMTTDEYKEERSRVQLIEEAQKTVYTLYSEEGQGSAFLYDENGSVITNAHVVEGSFYTVVMTKDGKEYSGKVIGYSNEIDVAVVHVPDLVGQKPFPSEKDVPSDVGQEVVALGSPLGYANTATVGYITGIDRTFNIPPHTFENVYQISAPIEQGNSGGPLLSVHDEKIVAINAAKRLDASNIAFSIPLYDVVPLIDNWIKNPLSENEIATLFYDDSGNYYYDLLWSLYDEFYFDDGDFADESDYYYYWYYDDDYIYDDYYDWDDGYWDDYWNDDYWDDYWDDYSHFLDEWDDYDYWDEEYIDEELYSNDEYMDDGLYYIDGYDEYMDDNFNKDW